MVFDSPLADGTVHCAGSAAYQICFRLPIANPNPNPVPNPITDPNPNPKADDTHSNKLRQLMAQLSSAIKLLQQLRNCVSNKLPKQTWIPDFQ